MSPRHYVAWRAGEAPKVAATPKKAEAEPEDVREERYNPPRTMRRIALINQKGGVGKTTSTVNLGAALAREGRRVVLVDLDPQANLTLHMNLLVEQGEPSTYTLLTGGSTLESTLRDTGAPNLRLVPSHIDLSGAELELAGAFGREVILRDAIDQWEREAIETHGAPPADYLLMDCPPSLGLLSINGLVATHETLLTLQTEFFALQGLAKLVEVVELIRRRLNPKLELTGILPCLYDSRLRLAREVLAEIRGHFGPKVFKRAIGKNVKLAEAPSYGKTIFEYAPESAGAQDYVAAAQEILAQERERAAPDANGDEAQVTLRPAPPPAEARPAKPGAAAPSAQAENAG